MADGDPTVQTFRMRFPEFAEGVYANELVAFALEEAALIMGSWPAPSRAPAMLYLTAHILITNAITSESGGRDVRHETLGRISESFAESPSTGKNPNSDISSTAYGRRYQRLQSKVISPVKTVGGKSHFARRH